MNKLEQAARALLAHWDTPAWKYLKPTGDLMADLREALAEQAEQDPVGYIDVGDLRELCNGNERQYSLFTEDKGRMVAIYAAPFRTKYLTDDEVEALAEQFVGQQSIALCRAVIAADREKNK